MLYIFCLSFEVEEPSELSPGVLFMYMIRTHTLDHR